MFEQRGSEIEKTIFKKKIISCRLRHHPKREINVPAPEKKKVSLIDGRLGRHGSPKRTNKLDFMAVQQHEQGLNSSN